jgi:hypothetical protein
VPGNDVRKERCSVLTYITLAINKVNELKDRDHTPKPNLFFSHAHLTLVQCLACKSMVQGKKLVSWSI